MRLDITKQFSEHSDRVKGIDLHPTEPWVLTTLYSGKVEIWSYETSIKVKTIDVTNVPVRAGKFIARKNWIIVGSDDFQVRVYNYNTGEKVAQFEAHPDYIRSIAVHPTRPYVLTSSDDMTIKLWNWENNWKMEQIFEGHQHYIMSLAFNPKDLNSFASACLDRTVKIWSLGSPVPNFTLMAHESKGVNYVEYYPQSDKPYLITASDDRTIKVWDYQTKACVATLEGHISNVSFAVFHPELPLIISGSEDASIMVWNANTYKLEKTLHYNMERAWCVAVKKGTNLISVGFDSGHIVLKLGDDKPAVSMDPLGKIIWAKHSDVYTSVIKASDADADDGDVLPLSQKELGSVEVFPSTLDHSPNGRFVTVSGDGEYIIYTALAWRNKAYGSALDFVWAQDSNLFAVRESMSIVKIFKNFKEKAGFSDFTSNNTYPADKIFGGALLAVKSAGVVSFYDWESSALVQRVDVDALDVIWSDSGELVLIVSNETVYALRFNKDVFTENLENDSIDEEEGCEGAFDVLYDVNETVTSGKWVGDVFIYTSSTNRLNYLVGGSITNIAHFDKPMYMLGYLSRDNKVYVADKDLNVVSYHVSQNMLEYQTVVLRGDMEQAAELLGSIEESERTKVARFLEKQGYRELALEITNDNEQKFELAVETLDLQKAYEIASLAGTEHKWKQLGDTCLTNWNLKLAIESFEKAGDLESLLLLYTSLNQIDALKKLGEDATAQGKYNVAFSALWAANDVTGCIRLLQFSKRFPESAIFGLTYTGDKSVVDNAVKLWKKDLEEAGNKSLSERITSPVEDSALFPQSDGVLIDVGDAPVADTELKAEVETEAETAETFETAEAKEEPEEPEEPEEDNDEETPEEDEEE